MGRYLQGTVGENVVAEAAALACSEAADCASPTQSAQEDCRVAVRWQQECARKIQAAEAVSCPAYSQFFSDDEFLWAINMRSGIEKGKLRRGGAWTGCEGSRGCLPGGC